MRAIVVDDEILLLEQFTYECRNISELEVLGYFDSALEALEFAKDNPIEIAFLDIKMPEMDGITLAEEIVKLYPDLIMIAVTSSENSTCKALTNCMHSVLPKPFAEDDLRGILGKIGKLSK